MINKEALEKLDNTLCLNSLSLRFNIDNEDHIDCKNIYEMIDCIDIIREALEQKEKQDKILEILKNKKVDIKLVLWAGQKVEAYNVVVREKNLFPREELTQEEFDLIRKWLDNEKI